MLQTSYTPMKLVLVTNAHKTKFESDIIKSLFNEGLDELHIHKPDFEKKDFVKFIDNIGHQHHSKIVLHECFSLVHDYDIRKIHISRYSNIVSDLILDHITLRGKDIEKSFRVSKVEDLYKPVSGANEIILGPVFSKSTYIINNQLISTDKLNRGISHSKLPVLGLGGVTVQTMDTFKRAGFNGVVMQSGLWRNADPVRAFIQMRDIAHAPAVPQPLRIAI